MDAKPAAPVKITKLLVILCAAVAAAGSIWQAWDMFGPAKRPMLQGWDDSFYYYWLPSVVIDHDLDFSNQLAQSGTVTPAARDEGLAQSRTATGLIPNKYPPGWALGSLPFFLLAHIFSSAGATGFEPIYLLCVWCGQLLYAAAGIWLAIKILTRFFPESIASFGVLLGWLASPLVYYQTARLSMSHSQVFALAMAAYWLALQIADGDSRRRIWMLLGFCAALLVVTRNVSVVYLAFPGLILAKKLRSAGSALCLGLGAAGPVAMQMIAWKILYGSWLFYSYEGERFDFTQWHLVDVLFSPRHGWFYWNPLMLVGVVGFSAWAWHRTNGIAWLVSLGAATALNAAWPTWWLGSSFGHRGFEVATFFAMVGLAVLLNATVLRPFLRQLLVTMIALAITWNILLLALYCTRRISHEQPVTYAEVARALANWSRESVRQD